MDREQVDPSVESRGAVPAPEGDPSGPRQLLIWGGIAFLVCIGIVLLFAWTPLTADLDTLGHFLLAIGLFGVALSLLAVAGGLFWLIRGGRAA